MQINVQGKQMDIGDALRVHVTERVEEINAKFFNHATDATVILSREGHGHGLIKTHLAIRIGHDIMVRADTAENDPYLSFDVACAKVSNQLRRYKERIRDNHEPQREESAMLKAPYYVIADEPEDNGDGVPKGDDPLTIAEMVTNIEKLSVSDAVMRLDLSNQTALLFHNAKHGGLNLVYRRNDGNIGWIDPTAALAQSEAAE